MNTPVITWACIIAAIALLCAIDAAAAAIRRSRHHHHHLLDSADERELLYAPGDPAPNHPDLSDCYDEDDL